MPGRLRFLSILLASTVSDAGRDGSHRCHWLSLPPGSRASSGQQENGQGGEKAFLLRSCALPAGSGGRRLLFRCTPGISPYYAIGRNDCRLLVVVQSSGAAVGCRHNPASGASPAASVPSSPYRTGTRPLRGDTEAGAVSGSGPQTLGLLSQKKR